MLINATRPEEVRAAVLCGRSLEQLEFEVRDAGLLKGNIYKGIIANVEPSLNACFVDFGVEKQGFLPFDEIAPSCWHEKPKAGKKKPRIEEVMRRRREIIVQVVKDATGNKGAALTTRVSLAGRYMVLMPLDESRGVSRKVESESQRKKIKELAAGLKIPDEYGFIVRTAGLKRTKTDLNRDGTQLVRLWKKVEKAAKKHKKRSPALLHEDRDLIIRMLRDYLTLDTQEVIVDTEAAYEAASAWFRAVMPRSSKVLTYYDGGIPLFDAYGVEDQIEAIFSRRVDLPSGGYILVDPTEALISIDVNSGRSTKQRSQEETALHTNLEAAAEVARQLRLRDLGGLIVIDFIDMVTTKQNRQVEKVLKDTLKQDKARTYVGKISENGLCEVNRQRIKQAIRLQTHRDCPACEGRGIIPSADHASRGLLRRIQAKAAAGKVDKVVLGLNPEIALHLLNKHRRDLSEIEDRCGILIRIVIRTDLVVNKMDIRWLSISQLSVPDRAELEAHREAILARGESIQNDEKLPEPLPDGEIFEDEEEEVAESRPASDRGDRKRKRGRRRRRGRGRDEDRPQDVETSDDASADTELDAAGETAEGEEVLAETPASEQDGEKRRKRRRRRRGRGRGRLREAGEDEEGSASGEHEPSADEEETTPPDEIAAADQDQAEGELTRSQRRRRRRKRKRREEPADATQPEVDALAEVVIEAEGLGEVDAAADTLELDIAEEDDAPEADSDENPAPDALEAADIDASKKPETVVAPQETQPGNGLDAGPEPDAEETQPDLAKVDEEPPGEVLIPPKSSSLFE
jgi:ribonuclease E